MLRNIAAVIFGLIVGSIVNLALLQLNLVLFPLPEGVELEDTERMREVVQGMPPKAWVLILAAHLGQAFVGGWFAARLGKSHPLRLALIVGSLSLVGGMANAILLATPAWTWAEMPFYLVFAWVAGRIEVARRAHRSAA